MNSRTLLLLGLSSVIFLGYGSLAFAEAANDGITGYKWQDNSTYGSWDEGEAALSGWTISLLNSRGGVVASLDTDGRGAYFFGGLGDGTYSVCETLKDGWVQTYPTAETQNVTECSGEGFAPWGHRINIGGSDALPDANFGNAIDVGVVEVFKFEDMDADGVYESEEGDTPLADWEFCLTASDSELSSCESTDEEGRVRWADLTPGNYTMSETYDSDVWLSTTHDAGTVEFELESLETEEIQFGNFGYGSISGHKYDQSTEEGVSGWTIYAIDPDGNLLEVQTDEDGLYTFENLTPGTYRVCEQVTGDGGSGKGDDGSYECQVPEWQVYPEGEYYTLDVFSNSRDLDNPNYDFRNGAVIKVTKYKDIDEDGELDDGESPVQGWEMCLYRVSRGEEELLDLVSCKDTDESGVASWTGLALANYRVVEEQRENWVSTDESGGARDVSIETYSAQSISFANADRTPAPKPANVQNEGSGGSSGGGNGPVTGSFGVAAPAVLGAFITVGPGGVTSSNLASNTPAVGRVLGASANSGMPHPSCPDYFSIYFMAGGSGYASNEVIKLQTFLNTYQSAKLSLTGVYDEATIAAVKAFQVSHADTVLTPWGLSAPTGNFYLTSARAANIEYCRVSAEILPMPELKPFQG